MKYSYLLILCLFLAACRPAIRTLPLDEFQEEVTQKEAVVIDVRTWDEYASGHIVNALNLDVKSDDFEQKFLKLGLDKNTAIAVYCLHAIRSKKAAEMLTEWGYTDVFHLEGGIEVYPEMELVTEFADTDLIGKWQVCKVDSVDWLNVTINDICRHEGEKESSFCAWIMFREDSTMGASVGCNGLGGNYFYSDRVLHIDDCCQTEMYCYELDYYERRLFSFLYGDMSVEALSQDSICLQHDNRQILLRRMEQQQP
ncbi:MAG: META domain-containing protein [Paludibacteraceae bacterium]|nr:META domain-containing protein [Paludibacteraceae bacterium]